MRADVRPFVREYKSRSRKAALHSLENCRASDARVQTQRHQRDDRAMLDLIIADRQLDQVQKEAEAVFQRKEVLASSSGSTNEGQDGSQFTGRVLPCLLQEPASLALQNDKKASGNRRSRSPHATEGRLASRSKRSPEMHRPANSAGAQSTLWSPSVSDEFSKLSDLEILSLIERAKTELDRRKEANKERLRAEIEAKLKSAGLDLGDLFESERRSTRGAGKSKENDGQSGVAPKYKNHVTGETWSGRGRSPKWVTAILQEREWTVEEFKQSDEFLIA
jgi:DNA-binding protein H-NS